MSSVLDVQLFLSVLVTLLVIMNSPGAVPIFLGLTASLTHKQRDVAARRAALVALGVIAAFALFGQQILTYLHISLPALQGAGGLLLLLVALQLLVGQESGVSSDAGVNVALVPLGTPILAGPGAIVATMLAVREANGFGGSWRWREAWSSPFSSCGCSFGLPARFTVCCGTAARCW